MAENAIRPLALGRKNYLFCGNHDAAENAAIMYSLLSCCKTHDVNPRQWLTDVFTKIPKYNSDYSLDVSIRGTPYCAAIGNQLYFGQKKI